ncbi:putative inorganic phosphate cotransporter [Caerostris extrusa]|uniref:Sialin n=1 Tax=Caerostris extrusa TaxID=172846 RepID=A0AAV4VZS6_CAEEX|nr:putative inorganic phosphate cotransporter [Caerostris extrusa]
MRVNLSVAIIAMVKATNTSNTTDSNAAIACPELLEDIKYDDISSKNISRLTGEFEWNSKVQGVVLGAFFYGYVITQVPGGLIAEKYGAKWLFGIGMLLTSLFTLLTPLAARWSVWALVVVRVIEGLGEGVAFPAMNTLIGQWAPRLERSRIASFIYTGSNLGTVGTLAASGALSNSTFLGGWPSVFYICGALGCVWFVLWALLIFETPESHPRISSEELAYIREGRENKARPPTPWKSILTSIPLWALVVAHTGQSWGFYTFFIQMPMYLSNILHFDLNKNGVLSALPNLMLSIVSIIAGIFADMIRSSGKLGITNIRKIFNTIGFFGPALCLIAVSLSGCQPMLIVILLSLAMGLNGFAYAGFIVTHVDMSPDFAGTLYGITNFFSNFTGFLVPAYVGFIMEEGQTVKNWGTVFITASVILMVTSIVYDIFCSAEPQPWGKDDEKKSMKMKPAVIYDPDMCTKM